MAKYNIKEIESFSNKHLKFLSKNFAGNEKEKLFQNDSSYISNLINAKTNTLLAIEIYVFADVFYSMF